MPTSTFTGVLDRLEKKGALLRAIDPRDRRSFALRVTPRGRNLVAAHDQAHTLLIQLLAQLLQPVEIKQLTAILAKIKPVWR